MAKTRRLLRNILSLCVVATLFLPSVKVTAVESSKIFAGEKNHQHLDQSGESASLVYSSHDDEGASHNHSHKREHRHSPDEPLHTHEHSHGIQFAGPEFRICSVTDSWTLSPIESTTLQFENIFGFKLSGYMMGIFRPPIV